MWERSVVMRRGLLMDPVLLALLLVLVFLEAFCPDVIHRVDSRVYGALSGGFGRGVAWFFSLSASLELFAVYVAVLALRDVYRGGRLGWETLGFYAALALSMVVVLVLKAGLRVPRPPGAPGDGGAGLLSGVDVYSFPSGHVARASTLAAYFQGRARRIQAALLWLWVLGVAVSRLVLGAHWLMDVAASLPLGVLCSDLAKAWTRWMQGRRATMAV